VENCQSAILYKLLVACGGDKYANDPDLPEDLSGRRRTRGVLNGASQGARYVATADPPEQIIQAALAPPAAQMTVTDDEELSDFIRGRHRIVTYDDMAPPAQKIVDAGNMEPSGVFPDGLTRDELIAWMKERFGV
jgi:hypothetical protein